MGLPPRVVWAIRRRRARAVHVGAVHRLAHDFLWYPGGRGGDRRLRSGAVCASEMTDECASGRASLRVVILHIDTLWIGFIRLTRQLLPIEPERLGIGPLGFGMPQQAMPVKRHQPVVPNHRQVRLLGRPPLRHYSLPRRRWWRGRRCWRWRLRHLRRHHDDRHGRWWQSGNQMGEDRNLTGGRHPQQHRPC